MKNNVLYSDMKNKCYKYKENLKIMHIIKSKIFLCFNQSKVNNSMDFIILETLKQNKVDN